MSWGWLCVKPFQAGVWRGSKTWPVQSLPFRASGSAASFVSLQLKFAEKRQVRFTTPCCGLLFTIWIEKFCSVFLPVHITKKNPCKPTLSSSTPIPKLVRRLLLQNWCSDTSVWFMERHCGSSMVMSPQPKTRLKRYSLCCPPGVCALPSGRPRGMAPRHNPVYRRQCPSRRTTPAASRA